MLLVAHILTALSSMALTTLLYFKPTKARLHTSYALVALTLASGTYLVVSTHAQMLQACTSGLLYLGIVGFGIVSATRSLAKQRVSTKNDTDSSL